MHKSRATTRSKEATDLGGSLRQVPSVRGMYPQFPETTSCTVPVDSGVPLAVPWGFIFFESWQPHAAIRSKHRDPNPNDNSLIRKETSTYKGFHSTFVALLCFLIEELLLGLGHLCLLLRHRFFKEVDYYKAPPAR